MTLGGGALPSLSPGLWAQGPHGLSAMLWVFPAGGVLEEEALSFHIHHLGPEATRPRETLQPSLRSVCLPPTATYLRLR